MKYLKLFESESKIPPSISDYFYDIIDTGVDFNDGSWNKLPTPITPAIVHQDGKQYHWKKWFSLEYYSVDKYIPEDISIAILRMFDDGFNILINVENPKPGQGYKYKSWKFLFSPKKMGYSLGKYSRTLIQIPGKTRIQSTWNKSKFESFEIGMTILAQNQI